MKPEALLLAVASRILEVGLREPYERLQLQRTQEALTKDCHCICDCQCGSIAEHFQWVLPLSCLTLLLLCICRQRLALPAEQYHGSPRRFGRGLVTVPAR